MKTCLKILMILLCGVKTSGQDLIRKEITKHVRPIELAWSDTNYAGFEAITHSIGDAQIVMLGEQDHGDATTMEAKAKLIRYLHERHNFRVLAFESDFYGLQQLREDTNVQWDEVLASIYPVWTQCSPLNDFFGFLSSSQLKITGIDSRMILPVSQRSFLPKTEPFIRMHLTDSLGVNRYLDMLNSLLKKEYAYQPSKADQLFFLASTDKLMDASDKESFLKQSLRNLKGFALQTWNHTVNSFPDYRDVQMGENLEWLINHRYPNEKVIVWAANTHISKRSPFKNKQSMGQYTRERFGEKVYVLGFTSHHGQSKRITLPNTLTLPAPPPNSLEQWIHTTQARFAFVDLRLLPPENKFLMKGFGHSMNKENWSEVFDGIFFIDEMKPCH